MPPLAGGDFALRIRDRAGERPLTCPNRSLSSSSRDKLGQLTVTKGRSRAQAALVNGAREHAFARAAFAEQNDRRMACGRLVRQVEHALHRGIFRRRLRV